MQERQVQGCFLARTNDRQGPCARVCVQRLHRQHTHRPQLFFCEGLWHVAHKQLVGVRCTPCRQHLCEVAAAAARAAVKAAAVQQRALRQPRARAQQLPRAQAQAAASPQVGACRARQQARSKRVSSSRRS
jgi:hypothetical protein